jgi:hypothetical protein
MIVVEAGAEDKVQLVLENALISNENGPAIYVKSADKVFLTAAEGTVNEISDGAAYTLTDDDTTLDAAVFSKADLTVNGSGKLTVSGSCKHALVSKDDLVVTAKDLSVTAQNVGLNGKDSVKLSGAAVSITAGSDGIRADNDTDAEKGFVSVADSTLRIVSGKDGIHIEHHTSDLVKIANTLQEQRLSYMPKAVRQLRDSVTHRINAIDRAKRLSLQGTVNYVTLLDRMSDMQIQQSTLLALQLTPPDVIATMPQYAFGTFDFDKAETIIAEGHRLMSEALDKYEAI